MKPNKVLKRLAKIEAWTSDVAERCSASAVREALQDVTAALARVKVAVSLPASSKTAKPSQKRKKAAVKKATPRAAAAPTAEEKTRRISTQPKEELSRAAPKKVKAKSKPTTRSKPRKTARSPVPTQALVQEPQAPISVASGE